MLVIPPDTPQHLLEVSQKQLTLFKLAPSVVSNVASSSWTEQIEPDRKLDSVLTAFVEAWKLRNQIKQTNDDKQNCHRRAVIEQCLME